MNQDVDDSRPPYDEETAQSLVGRDVIIGLTCVDHDGELVEQLQLHGDIIDVNETVVTVKLRESGEEFTLPPDLRAFEKAPPGEYTFRSSGEVVVNPDLMTTWKITMPDPSERQEQDEQEDNP